jgi:hypothetical protein
MFPRGPRRVANPAVRSSAVRRQGRASSHQDHAQCVTTPGSADAQRTDVIPTFGRASRCPGSGAAGTYFKKRVDEGDSPAKVRRALKRRLCRVVFRGLVDDFRMRSTAAV